MNYIRNFTILFSMCPDKVITSLSLYFYLSLHRYYVIPVSRHNGRTDHSTPFFSSLL